MTIFPLTPVLVCGLLYSGGLSFLFIERDICCSSFQIVVLIIIVVVAISTLSTIWKASVHGGGVKLKTVTIPSTAATPSGALKANAEYFPCPLLVLLIQPKVYKRIVADGANAKPVA